jgi:hypothetical protein
MQLQNVSIELVKLALSAQVSLLLQQAVVVVVVVRAGWLK